MMKIWFDRHIEFSSQNVANYAARQALVVDKGCQVKDIHVWGIEWMKHISWSNGYVAELPYIIDYQEPGIQGPDARGEEIK